jgi:alkylation response protein AidB-like acyl-CoA dehydrogenase
MRLALSAVTRTAAQRRVVAVAASTTSKPSPAMTRSTTRGVTTHSQLSSEHSMVYEMCRKFADEELSPNASKWDKDHSFPTEAVNKLVSCRL